MEKSCIKCGVSKGLEHYYKHQGMLDGHLNKCKECCRNESKSNIESKRKDPEWIEKERKRGREKYRKRKYKRVNKNNDYRRRYPEKARASNSIKNKRRAGFNLHHWSYRKEHWSDVIELSIQEHNKAHRFLVYDAERMMYRRFDTNELLDTKEKHESFITECIKNKED